MPANVKVIFANSLEDWAAVQAHELDTWPAFQDAVLSWRWALAIGGGVLVVWAASQSSAWVRVGSGLAVALVIYFGYPRYARNRYLTAALDQMTGRDNLPFLTGERTVEVTAAGLRIQSSAGDHLIRWTFVKAVDEGTAHIFVRFRYGLGLPIPKNCMTTAEKDALLYDLRAKNVRT